MNVTNGESLLGRVRPGSRVTVLVYAGCRMDGTKEYRERTGRAVMPSSHGGWVLNLGGRHGTPALADEENIVAVGGRRA